MKHRLADKGARAVEAWLEENGVAIMPRQARQEMANAGWTAIAETACDPQGAAWPIWDAMAAAAPAADTKGLAEAILDAIAGAHDDPDGKEPTA